MTAWKTFDERTAEALKQQVGGQSVSVEPISRPLFEGGDSVVVAPTLQKGAALVITAHQKSIPVAVEPVWEPVPSEPAPAESSAAPSEIPIPLSLDSNESTPIEIVAPEELEPAEPPKAREENLLQFKGETPTPLQTFGPTTWERADEAESFASSGEPEREITSADPEIWDIPSQAPAQIRSEDIPGAPSPGDQPAQSEEPHYVAAGFLGLDNYVEDEEEIARSKRPWWKKIFTD